jgi:hypothetical protein
MEEGLELAKYLPTSYKRVPDSEYVQFLWEAYQSNYEQEKYQFAYLSLHMLFMSFVYFNVWQIKHHLEDEFKTALFLKERIEKDFLEASSPFVFWKESERSIFAFLKLLGCPKNRIGVFKKLVDLRNDLAHSNGNIYFDSEESHTEKVEELIRCTEEIQEYSKPVIQEIYREFLIESWDEDSRQYIDLSDQIREALIHTYYFSEADIQFCVDFDIQSLASEEHYDDIESLHSFFCSIYSEEYEEEYCEVCSENERLSIIDYWPGGEFVDGRNGENIQGEIEIAECGYCGTTHFKCVLCSSVNALWDHKLDQETECEGCGATYLIDTSSDLDHIGEGYSYKLLADA